MRAVFQVYPSKGLPGLECRIDLRTNQLNYSMSTITTNDGTEIYYKDWDEGPPFLSPWLAIIS